jgi:signal transduction histidine kinase
MGLQNMRERAEALPGGKFLVRSASGQGTQLEIRWRDESASIH